MDDAERAGRHRLVADMAVAEVSDDVSHAVARPFGTLPVNDRDGNPPALERLHDSTANEAATTSDQYATTDP